MTLGANMKFCAGIFLIIVMITSTLAHATGQYLDDEPANPQASSAVISANANVESAVISSTPLEVTSISQAAPIINAAAIGADVNAQMEGIEQAEPGNRLQSIILKGVGLFALLIILSTIPALRGKGVFFWDITDVLISTVLSMLLVVSLIALLISFADESITEGTRHVWVVIVVLCTVVGYSINFIKAKLHNSAFIALLVAFGRLFLPLLILGAVLLARWYGAGRVSYDRQEHENGEEYKARIHRQERELSESKAKSAFWISLIAIASVWLYSKLIAKKEWRGLAGYFSKVA